MAAGTTKSRATQSPAEVFADLGRFNVQTLDLPGLLQRVVDMAKQAVVGATEVSVTLIQGEQVSTIATTGGVAAPLDDAQYQYMSGPCVSAARDHELYLVDDMDSDTRWPAFTSNAMDNAVHGSLSVGLPVERPAIGSLNFYATENAAFDEEDLQIARSFAGYAALAIANAHLYGGCPGCRGS